MNLERILASSVRQRILIELSKVESINIMGLVRATNSTYTELNRNIKILDKEEIVTDQHIGRLRMINLIRENQRTILLLKALKILSKQPRTIISGKSISYPIDEHGTASLSIESNQLNNL